MLIHRPLALWATFLLLLATACQQAQLGKPNEQGFYGKVKSVEERLIKYQNEGEAVAFQTESKLSYSPEGQLISVEQGKHRSEWHYNEQGLKSQILVYLDGKLDKSQSHSYHYNDKGQVLSESQGADTLVRYSYDSLGRISHIAYYHSDGSVSQQIERRYNAKGELSDEWTRYFAPASTEPQTTHYQNKYNEQGQMVERHYDNLREVLSYNERGLLASKAFYLDKEWVRTESYEYQYDSQGNWTQLTTYLRRPQRPVHKERETHRQISYY